MIGGIFLVQNMSKGMCSTNNGRTGRARSRAKARFWIDDTQLTHEIQDMGMYIVYALENGLVDSTACEADMGQKQR